MSTPKALVLESRVGPRTVKDVPTRKVGLGSGLVEIICAGINDNAKRCIIETGVLADSPRARSTETSR